MNGSFISLGIQRFIYRTQAASGNVDICFRPIDYYRLGVLLAHYTFLFSNGTTPFGLSVIIVLFVRRVSQGSHERG